VSIHTHTHTHTRIISDCFEFGMNTEKTHGLKTKKNMKNNIDQRHV